MSRSQADEVCPSRKLNKAVRNGKWKVFYIFQWGVRYNHNWENFGAPRPESEQSGVNQRILRLIRFLWRETDSQIRLRCEFGVSRISNRCRPPCREALGMWAASILNKNRFLWASPGLPPGTKNNPSGAFWVCWPAQNPVYASGCRFSQSWETAWGSVMKCCYGQSAGPKTLFNSHYC